MADNQASHITVKDTVQGAEITYIFAISEEISSELDRHMQKPAGKDLVAWLDDKGCKLDYPDGPAVVRRGADGSTYEYCYKDGKLVEPFAPPSVIQGVTVRRIASKAPGKQHPPASA